MPTPIQAVVYQNPFDKETLRLGFLLSWNETKGVGLLYHPSTPTREGRLEVVEQSSKTVDLRAYTSKTGAAPRDRKNSPHSLYVPHAKKRQTNVRAYLDLSPCQDQLYAAAVRRAGLSIPRDAALQ